MEDDRLGPFLWLERLMPVFFRYRFSRRHRSRVPTSILIESRVVVAVVLAEVALVVVEMFSTTQAPCFFFSGSWINFNCQPIFEGRM